MTTLIAAALAYLLGYTLGQQSEAEEHERQVEALARALEEK